MLPAKHDCLSLDVRARPWGLIGRPIPAIVRRSGLDAFAENLRTSGNHAGALSRCLTRDQCPAAAFQSRSDASYSELGVADLAFSRNGSALAFKNTPDEDYFAADVVSTLVTDYSILVAALTDPKTSQNGLELAYGRVLGTRGALCRLCPSRQIWTLRSQIVREWRRTEERLRDYFAANNLGGPLWNAASRVENRWDECAGRLVLAAASGSLESEIAAHLGYLKAVDALALHLGQRDIFMRSGSLSIPIPNPFDAKVRMRLISMLLALNRSWFAESFPAIRSYRSTFSIDDPGLYPWWFVDARITERQAMWTYRRLAAAEFDWRFEPV